jgi:hypothetical protein
LLLLDGIPPGQGCLGVGFPHSPNDYGNNHGCNCQKDESIFSREIWSSCRRTLSCSGNNNIHFHLIPVRYPALVPYVPVISILDKSLH